LGANRCGVDKKGYNYKGASIAIDYQGEVMARAKDDTEEIIYATLDKDALKQYRDKFPVALDWD
ncbi:MAG: nitrilase-related carbon-nitrogen hydrolase, partial [Bacteroidales bacterium]|nr:nitrilase-related carbon-nitrogen hydrolase [Bacteroidales bacterium]